MTTDFFSRLVAVTRAAGIVSTWNVGRAPTLSALSRKKFDSARSPLSTTRTETVWLGVSTKLNELSAAKSSVPAFTMPRTAGSASVNCWKDTDVDAPAGTVTGLLSICRPSISSETGTLLTASVPVFCTPAVTVMRSWPENIAREKLIDGTERLPVEGDATETVVSLMPSPRWTSSAPVQPERWKSEMSTASRRGSADCDRMLSASFSAGP